MDELVAGIEGSKDAFLALLQLRKEQPDRFSAVAEALLQSASKNTEIWRYLAMHFIRAERYDLAGVASARHLSVAPRGQEAFLRRFRVAILAGDSETALKMLDEQKERFGLFQYECSRFLYLQRFAKTLIPMAHELARVREHACEASNRALLNEFRIPDADPATVSKEAPEATPQISKLMENTRKFASLAARLDGVKKITVLGNGGSLKASKLGTYIDSQECVVRINFPKLTELEEDVGTRTDLVLFTEAFLHTPDNLASLKALRSRYEGVPGIAIDAGRNERVEKDKVLDALDEHIALAPDGIRTAIRALSYQFATTGVCALVTCFMILRKEIEIFGFDFYDPSTAIHFFSKSSNEAFIGHETAFEKFLVNSVYKPT